MAVKRVTFKGGVRWCVIKPKRKGSKKKVLKGCFKHKADAMAKNRTGRKRKKSGKLAKAWKRRNKR